MHTNTKDPGIGVYPDFDAKELARLARLCVGSTSTILFSQRAGLSRSFLSAVLNGKLRNIPTRKSLEKMASPEAQPQNGITAAQLLAAAGYTPSGGTSSAAPIASPKLDDSSFLNEVLKYCAADIEQMRITVQCMVGELIKRDTSPRFTIDIGDRWSAITYEGPGSDSPLLSICVPAFVSEEHLAVYSASATVLCLSEAKSEYKGKNVRFCVLTNSKALCDYLSKAFRTETNILVYLTVDFYSVTLMHPKCEDAENNNRLEA